MLLLAQDRAAEILVVDDAPENLLAIEAALEGLSSGLVFASSGEAALRCLLDRDFALILLDVEMPSMNGLETARLIRARKRSRHVPIIFITAHDKDDEEILAGYRLGAVDFLAKPIDPEILRAKASVFVELQRRTIEVARQAVLIEQHERAERERALADQRRQLEAEALRNSLAEQRQYAEALSRANLELEHIRAQLEHSNERLALADRRKDEFLAVLAHELRNPLAAMMSGVDLLGSDSSPEAVATVRPIMERQGLHLIRLIDDLLDIARITAGKLKLRKQMVSVEAVLDDALELAKPGIVANDNVLELDCECDRLQVFADPVRLAQVVANLLSNAARHTDRGGRIRVSARPDEDDHVRIIVADDGQGMSPALISRVFEMFVQAKAGGGGLGIGLTLVRQITQMHDGEVAARSDGPGKGSEFELRLPLATSADEPEAREPEASAEHDGAHMRVAVIDDNGDARELTRSILECWGHSVVEASDGEDGIELILSERPDVAIIDIGLRDIEGYEVARRLRSELGEGCPRLIAMTGYSQAKDRERAFAAGFHVYLAKPARSDALRSAICEAAD